MKQKIVFILGVLFAANVGYSGSQYNQNARSISYNNGAIKTDNAGNSNGKIKSRTDSYGQVRGDTGGTIKVIDYREEEPIYSKNGDLLYTIQPVGDDGGLIVRMLDGHEIELKDGKSVDRWKTNMTILENMESVFGGADGVCKSGLERGFIVDKNYKIKDVTEVSKETSVNLKTIDSDSKAVIHNHPKRNNKSHAWPSLSDIFSAFSSTGQEDYIVDCYDKKTLVRIDSDTGIIYKIDDIGRETVAKNLYPDFQDPEYDKLKEELDKVSTWEELKDLLEKKPYEEKEYTYGNMPYVPADFELLKKKAIALRAAEKNKSGTLQNAFSKDGDVGVNGHAVDLSQFDQYVQEIILAYKEFNSTLEECVELSETPINISGENTQVTGLRGIVARGNAIEVEKKTRWRKWQIKYEKSIRKLNDKTLALENALQSLKDKDISSDKIIKIRKMLCRPILPYIRKTIEIAKRADPDIADSIIKQFSALEKFISDDNTKFEY